MRTLDKCYEELKKCDPDTEVSKNFIRKLALQGKIKVVKCGRKRLINFDDLLCYLSRVNTLQLVCEE